jgi:hypothetical protein
LSGESASALYAASVDRLRLGDRVTPVELLRRETFALHGEILPAPSEADVEAGLSALRAALERLLAVAFALLDHGGGRGALEVAWSAQTLATELGEGEAEPTEPMLALALRDLSLSLLADCLGRGRLEPLPRLRGVTVPSRFERQTSPLFQTADLRYPNAFGRSAERAYTSWSGWLAESELCDTLSYVRDSAAFKDAIAEAELVAALAFAQHRDNRTFCAVIGAGGAAERRLRQQVGDPRSVRSLASFLALPQGQDLGDALNELYGRLGGGDGFGTGAKLITADQTEHRGATLSHRSDQSRP